MLEPPDIADERIIACLRADYGLEVAQLAFLPLGADEHTAVYRAVDRDGVPYFVKLRRGVLYELSVALPRFLSDQGIAEVIPPLLTRRGRLTAALDPYTVILYPFVEGRNGFALVLSPGQWAALGVALERLHTLALPPSLAASIRKETFDPRWRESLRRSLERSEEGTWADPLAAELARFLRPRREQIAGLVVRAERLALELQARPRPSVVCHADVHAGNILIDTEQRLYIVDWDDPILAPKERDLMFVGGAQGFVGRTAHEEERLFYRGYGLAQVDPVALAYYRYERIVVDMAIYCQQILWTDQGGADRQRALHYLMSNFGPNGTIEMARRSDKTLHEG